jgi:hypothetical protein
MDFSKQTFSAIIYGSPGMGKTTLALSAPKPVLIDFDNGVSRVAAAHRVPTIVCNTYEEVLADIDSPDMKEFETIVIDTGGSFVTYLKDWAFRTKKDCKTQKGTPNTLKQFGYAKTEFMAFTEKITKVMHKNVIYVFHSEEKADKDGNPVQRLMCEGAARNLVWNPCDFGGYLQMINNERKLCFTPTDDYFAKGSHGIVGNMSVPLLKPGMPNNFMTKLFEQARQSIISETEELGKQRKLYDEVMGDVKTLVDNVVDEDSANLALATISDMEHALTSKKEAGAMLTAKAKELGLRFDPKARAYVVRDGDQ